MSCCVMLRGHEGVKPLWVQEFVHAQPSRPLEGTRRPRAFVYVTVLFHAGDLVAGSRLRIAHLGRVAGITDWSHTLTGPEGDDWLTLLTNELPGHEIQRNGAGEVRFGVDFTPRILEELEAAYPECATAATARAGVTARVFCWDSTPEITPRPDEPGAVEAPFVEIELRPPSAGFHLARLAFETDANVEHDAEFRTVLYHVLGPVRMFQTLNRQVAEWESHLGSYRERLEELRRYWTQVQYEIVLTGDPEYHCRAARYDDGRDFGGGPRILAHPAGPQGQAFVFIPEDHQFHIALDAECKSDLAPLALMGEAFSPLTEVQAALVATRL
jgi:hypothetical protein